MVDMETNSKKVSKFNGFGVAGVVLSIIGAGIVVFGTFFFQSGRITYPALNVGGAIAVCQRQLSTISRVAVRH